VVALVLSDSDEASFGFGERKEREDRAGFPLLSAAEPL